VELCGAVVAITGASAGIGRAAAVAFARAGSRVVLGARRLDRLQEIVRAIEAQGGEALGVALDVGDRAQVQAFVGAALAHFGTLDVLVNNAGYGVRGTVEQTPADDFERLMRINYLGTVYGCQAALPVMRRNGRGVIVNVSSIVGHRALPGGGAYAASKAAQISLTESLRAELRGTGIAACTVHPIGTATEFAEVAERASPGVPAGSGVGPQQTAEQVARAIVRCARHPRPEVYPHAASRAIVWLNAIAPSLVDRLSYGAAKRAGRIA
jgi:NAD(P)-dependent dehydrogenase (short-subunit alcohol dehydrogenase family)